MDPLEFVGFNPTSPEHREAFRSLQRFAEQVEPDLVTRWRSDFPLWVRMYGVLKLKAAGGPITWALLDITPTAEDCPQAPPGRGTGCPGGNGKPPQTPLVAAIAATLEQIGMPPQLDCSVLAVRVAGFLELVPDLDFDGRREVWVGTCHLCARRGAWHGDTLSGVWSCHHCGKRGVIAPAP